ncbi:MAG TPA: heme-binding protein [Woeseiaceae bacterium]|nr:heme-binding protein [Woeseiaceae bacterium]
MATEEPAYEILLETKYYDVRRYAPYIVAEVDVDDDFRGAGNSAFRVLAGYIFGDNEPKQKMNMTAPVESRDDNGPFTYSFVMERKYTMETLPKPTNPDIKLVQRPERVMAVHRYSGTWSEQRYAEHEKILLEALATDRVQTKGAPVFARYDAPFTPWFLRRNEIMIEIQWKEQQ